MTISTYGSRFIQAFQWRLSICAYICHRSIAAIAITLASWLRLPGVEFARFFLRCARNCTSQGKYSLGRELSVTPVHCTRYFEFAAAWRMLRMADMMKSVHKGGHQVYRGKDATSVDNSGEIPLPDTLRCLDVSSPCQFSAYVLAHLEMTHVCMVNPDLSDLKKSGLMLECLGNPAKRCEQLTAYAGELPWPDVSFDLAWSISVVEHIPEPFDMAAVGDIWRVIKPGGLLFLSFPVSRTGAKEFRDQNQYGLQKYVEKTQRAEYFFQRIYSRDEMKARILNVMPESSVVEMEIWGESIPGLFRRYEKLWIRYGERITCWDAILMKIGFRAHKTIDALPGMGVCCLCLRKLVK